MPAQDHGLRRESLCRKVEIRLSKHSEDVLFTKFPRMSALSEIEAAVDRLSFPEQEILLEHLARKLSARPPVTDGSLQTPETPVLPVDSRFRSRSLREVLDDIAAEERYW
jgi:hypothetical protein